MKGIFLVKGSGKLLCDGRPDQHQDQDQVQQCVDGYDVVFDYRLDFDITCRPGTCGKWDSNSPFVVDDDDAVNIVDNGDDYDDDDEQLNSISFCQGHLRLFSAKLADGMAVTTLPDPDVEVSSKEFKRNCK